MFTLYISTSCNYVRSTTSCEINKRVRERMGRNTNPEDIKTIVLSVKHADWTKFPPMRYLDDFN